MDGLGKKLLARAACPFDENRTVTSGNIGKGGKNIFDFVIFTDDVIETVCFGDFLAQGFQGGLRL